MYLTVWSVNSQSSSKHNNNLKNCSCFSQSPAALYALKKIIFVYRPYVFLSFLFLLWLLENKKKLKWWRRYDDKNFILPTKKISFLFSWRAFHNFLIGSAAFSWLFLDYEQSRPITLWEQKASQSQFIGLDIRERVDQREQSKQ